MKNYPTDNERHHRWCEDCQGKYEGTRECPACSGTNTGIDEPVLRPPKVAPHKQKNDMQKKLDELATLCLHNAEEHHDYSDEDLFNATEIFQHVLMAKMWDAHAKHLTMPQMEKLAEEVGANLRQHILLATGKDMHKVVDDLINKHK